MARNSLKQKALRTLASLLAIIVAMGVLVLAFSKTEGGQLTPKLGLDLEGGTELILQPVLDSGQVVSPSQIEQAVNIIRQRIDANGVAEAEISTLGGTSIDIAIPGKPSVEQLDAVRKPSLLRFRAVLITGQGATSALNPPTPVTTPTTGASGGASGGAKSTSTATPTATPSATATTKPTPAASGGTTPTPTATAQSQMTAAEKTAMVTEVATSLVGINPKLAPETAQAQAKTVVDAYDALNCATPGVVNKIADTPGVPMATCSEDLQTKFILGPVEIEGSDIADASSGFKPGPNGQPTNEVEVTLKFTSAGATKFAAVTKRLFGLRGPNPTTAPDPRASFAVVLDKFVITYPTSQAVIENGEASITGSFTPESGKALAQQLKFGALPMSFTLQTQNDITPQLGKEQLGLGLLAGGIGLLLVVIYSLFQYRALGLVTVASLSIAALITYLAVTILGTTHGLRLTMAGVTGLIVAIGVTADSFIVYFERIRDEVRDGRPLVAAVETGWRRARRTILAADAVNLIAAVVLYILATSNVRGFAFTLGLTTIIDVGIVMLFTHPVMQLLARTEFFGGGHEWSGLSPQRLGANTDVRYRGRGQFGPSDSEPKPARRPGINDPGGAVV